MNTQEAEKLSTPFLQFCRLLFKVFVITSMSLFLTSCIFSQNIAPSSDLSRKTVTKVAKPSQHIVERGETLFAIAWQYGIDYKQLAIANGIGNDFLIYPGQALNLSTKNNNTSKANSLRVSSGSPSSSNSPIKSSKTIPSKSKSVPRKVVKKAPVTKPSAPRPEKKSPRSPSVATSSSSSQKLIWRWPAKGKVITNFSSAKGGGRGIDLSGKKGDSVTAAASGTIVYAGSGLRGYGQLIIIKHSDRYLSAYAHNSRIRVKEGQKVKVGQHIADIGSSGSRANISKLHFEIRRNGQSVNPLTYLPKRKA
jgi:lipoprotein NlpD